MRWLESKSIVEKMKEEDRAAVAALGFAPRLVIVWLGENKLIEVFIRLKKKYAQEVGVKIIEHHLSADLSGNALRAHIRGIVHEPEGQPPNHGLVIQLRLPEHIDETTVLPGITPEKDVDVLTPQLIGKFIQGKAPWLPPVVAAIAALLDHYDILVRWKTVVVVGKGPLVGMPCREWFDQQGARVFSTDKDDPQLAEVVRKADILIAGAGGAPNIITGDMLKDEVVIFDAATSEVANGKIAGNVDIESAQEKASAMTPLKGGIGPLTVAFVVHNTIKAAQQQAHTH
ncbi:MAG: bifunctional 5,10-methylenetetrahydrofolate dehydrogenase/5,10-methenyltetrahydrofolate cyclohydrolase [Patescibacteria group bacterium]